MKKSLCECLKNDTSKLSSQLSLNLPREITIDECIAYLNGLSYFDLRGATNLKNISKKILVDNNNPFLKLNKDACKRIDDYYILRNYIAHRSNKSKKTLNLMYLRYQQNTFIEAGDFLLSIDPSKNDLHIQLFEGSFWLTSFDILQFLYPKTFNWIMANEEIYNEKCQARFLKLINLSLNKPKS